MRKIPYIFLLSFLPIFFSCQHGHDEIKKDLDQLKAEEKKGYTVAYNYSTYLSTSKSISPEEAIPMISELISMGYPTAARYCIDNLERNGIHSADLLALRGLCYQHELQPQLAGADLESALKSDPANEKIRTLLNNLRKETHGGEAPPDQSVLFKQGLELIRSEDYVSALEYMHKAAEAGSNPQPGQYVSRLEKVLEGEDLIKAHPLQPRGYMQMSQALAAMKQYEQAREIIDGGLKAIPDNLNLILARALVWVQEGKSETARQYLWEQEQRGIVIDPAVKQKILQPQN